MRNKLIGKEKQFLRDVLKELKQYDISLEERENIKRQILEHIQECREHGEDSIDDLGTPQLFVKDFIEINEIDLQVKMKQLQNEKENSTHLSYVAYSSHLLLTSSRKLHFQYF